MIIFDKLLNVDAENVLKKVSTKNKKKMLTILSLFVKLVFVDKKMSKKNMSKKSFKKY